MASLTIRRLDEELKSKLRIRAAHHGRSMEEEAREILRLGVSAESHAKINMAQLIRRRIEPLGGVELAIPPREPMRTPPKFTK